MNDAMPAIGATLMTADYVCHMTRVLGTSSKVLRGTALVPDDLETPDRRITVAQNLRCVANAMQLAPAPDWYLDWGTRIGEYLHGPLTPAMLTAPTLGDGLDAFCAHFGMRIPYLRLRSGFVANAFSIELVPLVPAAAILPVLVEIPLLILQRYITMVRGQAMNAACIELAYRPGSGAITRARWFDCELRFDADRHALTIPAAWRQTRNLGANAAVWQAALAECAGQGAGAGNDAVAQVRASLLSAFSVGNAPAVVPSLADMARTMNVSTRTLIRRLRQSGTTYHAEVDCARHHHALIRLGVEQRPVTAVAYDLAYADPAAFAKAFKRWTGTTPGAYKKLARGRAP